MKRILLNYIRKRLASLCISKENYVKRILMNFSNIFFYVFFFDFSFIYFYSIVCKSKFFQSALTQNCSPFEYSCKWKWFQYAVYRQIALYSNIHLKSNFLLHMTYCYHRLKDNLKKKVTKKNCFKSIPKIIKSLKSDISKFMCHIFYSTLSKSRK